MQTADIRLVPSKTISIGFENTTIDYDQPAQDKDTSSIISNSYDATTMLNTSTLDSFNDLAISPSEDHLMDDEEDMLRYGSFLSQQEENEQEEEVEPQLPSATADAMETYCNITENIYCGSATGKSIAEESMPCECKYRPDVDNPDDACGDDNYCINRMMFMECMVDDCPCDRYCRNRRFQLRQYARVDVIRTDKKGFGLRALTDLPTNAFIMEYIGEVIPNHEFIKRTKEYEAAGLEHYYFMTLKTDEIIDATKKGCLARFINHSCNPNSVTQKWVVGKNMRIGIFTRRPIKAGSELTFDYKFERYGAVAQPCFCGEASCKGFIGGSLKSDSKLPAPISSSKDHLDITNNALENEDDEDDDEDDDEQDEQMEQDDDSDTVEAVTLTQKKMLRKMHRRRASEPLQDPREVQSFVKRMLDSVGKSHLVLKLLLRLELTDAETPQGKDILKKFVRLHGLKMLKFWLGEWKNDTEILIKVLQVLSQLPLANKNGLEDCKMFEIVDRLTVHEQEDIRQLAEQLLQDWSQLKSVYRIPKRIPTEKSNHQRETEEDDDMQSQVSSLDRIPPSHYHSSREFFDPDEDYFEYLSMDVDAAEIQWKIDYPPRSMIPTAPRAMIDACIKNGFYGYGRPTRQQSTYPSYPPSIEHQQHHYTMLDQDALPYKSKYTNDMITHSPDNASPAGSIATTSTSMAPTRPAAALTPPLKLPNNWRSAYAEDGTIYYYHRFTNKTQWQFPEERVSSIEGVNQSDLEDLVEKTIQESENKKRAEKTRSESPAISITSKGQAKKSPRVITPSVSRRGSGEAASLDENELKKEVGKIVTKYLSSKQKTLWKGDKYLFKELARKITHHIVDREIQSSRKIHAMNSSVRTKIEKFIDSHGSDLVLKVQRKRKHQSSSSTVNGKSKMTESPASAVSSEEMKSTPIQQEQPQPQPQPQSLVSATTSQSWEETPSSPSANKKRFIDDTTAIKPTQDTSPPTIIDSTKTPPIQPPSQKEDAPYYYSRRSRVNSPVLYNGGSSSNSSSRFAGEYVRPGYSRHYSNSYYRYPPRPPSPYYRGSNSGNGGRYYSSNSARDRSPPPPYYYYHHHHRHSASSSRRGSLSDDDLDSRRRWDQ